MDCFVASAFALRAMAVALLAMTKARATASPPRDLASELGIVVVAHETTRAQGMPGARRTHCLACKTKKTHAGRHRYAEITPALPAQWLYGCSALSLVSGLFSHHRLLIGRFGRRAEIASRQT